ncbi:phosphoribosyltransferase [Gloeothece verrucosa]|uniref:Phosphoribosyltransferase n=1 Tax=Gloeothece verrucosa (strain PCC 7822) TaxID=497965 RepID=E0UCK8_GLOV7|nr:phosphoribosyltransferase family protein [Gloeothece verrucosa]ADN14079.1 phosphoribosyltransferase [Gloeothece verrucosa PCC 7822]
MSDLYVSWSEYHKNIESLAITIYQSGWEFNQIVCLAKGGLRLGDILSRLFRQPLAILSASSYGGTSNQVRGKLVFSEHLSMTTPKLGNRILLVDDLADSGITLSQTINWLKSRYQIQEIRTAVIWHKASSSFQPDYAAHYLSSSPWIHQPFEIYEQMTVAQLAQVDPQAAIIET